MIALGASLFSHNAPRSAAAGTGLMLVNPGAQTVPQGTQYTIAVDAESVTNLGAYEFEIAFDPALLAFQGVANGPFLGSTGRSVICPPEILDEVLGRIRFSCGTLGLAPAGPIGGGQLASVTFFTLAEGTSALDFTIAAMADESGDGFTNVTAQNGSVTIFGGTPPPTFTPTSTRTITPTPTATVPVTPTPTGIVPPGSCGPQIAIALCFDPTIMNAYQDVAFDIAIRVEDVSNLGAFDIAIQFSDAVFGPPAPAPGPFLGSTGRPVQCQVVSTTATSMRYQCITLGIDDPQQGGIPGASGSGSIAIFTFVPLAQGTTFMNLTAATLLTPGAAMIIAGYNASAFVTVGPQATATPCPGGICPTSTPTATSTSTPTQTPTPSATPTETPCPGACPSATHTSTSTSTATATNTPTATPTPGPATVRVFPPAAVVSTGDVVNIEVLAEGVTDLAAFSFEVGFDPSRLQKQFPSVQPFLGSTGRQPICFVSQPAQPDPGSIQFNCVTTGGVPPPGVTGSGSIAIVPFLALTAGVTPLDLRSVSLTHPDGSHHPAGPVIDGSVTVTVASTPTPCIGTCPSATATATRTATATVGGGAAAFFSPSQQVVPFGQDVEVLVSVSGVSGTGSYEFNVTFNPNTLAFVSSANDSFLGSTGRSLFCPPPLVDLQHVRFGCASSGPQSPPAGGGTLARLRFSTIAPGPGDLSFDAIDLADTGGNSFPVAAQDGSPAAPEVLVTIGTLTPTRTPTRTATPTISPTPTQANTPTAAEDLDLDGIFDAVDNCPGVANQGQQNADADFLDLSPPKAFDDLTWPNSDLAGDACDPDADNDGRPDADEASGANCLAGPVVTSPTSRDSDGDRTLDLAECLLGSNPADPASKPPASLPPDADADQLPDALDPVDNDSDADDDGLLDGIEFRYYHTDPLLADTDSATEPAPCSDAREVASVNGDRAVTSADLAQVAQSFGSAASPNYLVDFDANKDGTIASSDLAFVAQRFGPC